MIDAARVGGSAPSYTHSFSMLGQYLNQQKARAVTITETGAGFMVICFPDGNLLRQRVLNVSHADLLGMDGAFEKIAAGRRGGILRGGNAADKRHPVVPQGYHAFLSALGHKLDQRGAVSVTVCDTDKKIYVDFWIDRATFVIRDQRRTAVSARQSDVYDLKSVTQLIETVRSGITQETARNLGALRINPHDYLSAISAAQLLEMEGKYREAESFYARVAAQVTDVPEAHYHLARLALVREDAGAALTNIRKAMADHEDVAAYQDLLGCILRATRKQKEAATAFERAAELDPDNAIIHYHLAKTYEALGCTEDAEREMAFSGNQQAAPAWAFPEDGSDSAGPLVAATDSDPIDDSPASTALLPTLPIDTSSAATALLPPIDATSAPAPLQTFTTEWSPALPGPGAAQAAPASFETSTGPGGGFPVDPAAGWTPPAPQPAWNGAAPWAPGQPAPQQWAQPPATPPPGWVQPPPGYQPTQPSPGYQQAAATGMPQPGGTWPQGAAPQPGPPPGWVGPPAPPQGWQPQPAPAGPPEGWQPPAPAAPAWVQRLGQPAPVTPDGPPAQPSGSPPQQEAAAWYPAAQQTLPTQPAPFQAPAAFSGHGMEPAAPPAVPEAPPQTAQSAPPSSPGGGWVGTQASPAAPAIVPAPVVETRATGQGDTNANAVELAAEILMIQRAIDGEPNRADLHRKLGFLLARQGRTAEAATEFRKALQCSRTNL